MKPAGIIRAESPLVATFTISIGGVVNRSIAMAFILCSSTVGAQVPAVLLEACNSISDAAHRLECLKEATNRPAAQIAAYDPVLRAFTGLKGSLEIGLSYLNYQAAVQEIARELAVFERGASPESQKGLAKLKEALETYSDAGRFWNAEISFYANGDNRIAYGGGLPMEMTGLQWMIRKHGLPTQNSDIWGFQTGVPTDLGRRRMWNKAGQLAEEGFVYLKHPAEAERAEARSSPKAGLR